MYCFAAATLCFVALEGASSTGGFPGSFPWLAATAGLLDLSLGWNFWNQLLAESIATHNGIISGTRQASYRDQSSRNGTAVEKVQVTQSAPNWIRYPNQQLSVETDAGDDTLYLKQIK